MISLKPAGRAFALYLAASFAAWTAYVLWIYPHVAGLGEASFAQAASGTAVRLVIWLMPVFFMLGRVDRAPPLRALALVEHWRRGVLVGGLIAAVLLVGALIRFGWPSAPYLTWGSLLGPSFSVGFFEEIPFRGFILQKLATRMNFWTANAVTSLLFVGIHLPGWITLHLFSWMLAANILVFSLIAGAVFKCSRSLWGLHHWPRRQRLRFLRPVSRTLGAWRRLTEVLLYNLRCSRSVLSQDAFRRKHQPAGRFWLSFPTPVRQRRSIGWPGSSSGLINCGAD